MSHKSTYGERAQAPGTDAYRSRDSSARRARGTCATQICEIQEHAVHEALKAREHIQHKTHRVRDDAGHVT